MVVSANDFRLGMRQLAAAVNVVTTATGTERGGLTATAAMSLTAEPPQLGLAVNKTASAFRLFVESRRFALNVLSFDQVDIAGRFAGAGGTKGEARFEGAVWTTLATGAPTLKGAAAVFDCEIVQEIDLGTHVMFVGLVHAVEAGAGARPLLYLDGSWASLIRASGNDLERYRNAVDLSIEAIDTATSRYQDPEERLRSFVELFTAVNIQQSDVTRDFMTHELYVRPEQLSEINSRKAEFDIKLRAMLDDGVRAGAFAIEDTRLASLAIAGMIGWMYRWYREEGRLAPDQIAQRLARLVTDMVGRSGEPSRSKTDPDQTRS